MSEQVARPREVVTAAVMTVAGSLVALVGIFSSSGDVRSPGMRREIESLVADDRFDGLGVTVGQVVDAIHVLLMLLAACCVAAIVLGVFVLRRHRPSQIALTALAAPIAVLSLAAGITGMLMGLFIAYTVSLLWKPAARSWFKEDSMSENKPPDSDETGGERPGPYRGYGEPARQGPEQPPRQGPEQGQPQRPEQGQPYGQGSGGGQGYGQIQQPYGQQPAGGQGWSGAPNPFARDPHQRPGTVVGALVMTWVGVGFLLLIGVVCLAFAGNQELIDAFEAEMQDPAFDADDLTLLLRVVGAVLLIWGLLVGVVSIFAWRRQNWARITLTVMAAIYGVLQLFALLTGELVVVISIAYVAVIAVLMWLQPARDWYAARSAPQGYGPHGGGPGQGYGGGPGQGYGGGPGQGYGGGPGQGYGGSPPTQHQPW